MKQANYESAKDALLGLNAMHVQMENALDLLYAVYEAERQGNIPQGLNANAIWCVWDYMGTIVTEMGEAIKAGIHA